MALQAGGADGPRSHACAWLHYRIGVNQRASDPARCLEHLAEARRLAVRAGDEILDTYASIIEGLVQEFQGSLREGISKIEAGVDRLDRLAQTSASHHPHPLQTTLFADSARISHQANQGALQAPNPGRGTLVQWYAAAGLCDKALSTGSHYLKHEVRESSARESAGHAVYDACLGTGVAHIIRGKPEEALEALTSALEGYRRWDHRILASATCHTIVESVLLPYFTERVRERADLVELANRLVEGHQAAAGSVNPMGYYDPSAAWPLIVRGEWDTAWEISSGMVQQTSAAVWKWRSTHVLGWLSWARGQLDDAWQYVASVIAEPDPATPGDLPYLEATGMQRLAARIALDSGDPATAKAWLETHDDWLEWADAVHGRAEGILLWADYHLADGDPGRARDAVGRALRQALTPRQPLALMAVHRMLGRLNILEDRLEAAHEHLTTALQLAERSQAVYEVALANLDLAELAVAARRRTTALDRVSLARATFESLGARPPIDRALELENMLAGNSPTYPAGLSSREVEVLCLVASGMSNRDVADRLFLSVRTVERHLSNIYRKIDVHSRVQASTFVDLHQLSVPPTA
jgi:ATP/maltotriose-dependent transcriptional regulator MalT